MKKIIALLWLLLIYSGTAYAQMSKEQIERIAGTQSLVLQSEGWKATSAGMPIKYQMIKKLTMQQEMEGNRSKYIFMDGRATDEAIGTARALAMKNARKNLLLALDDSDTGSQLDFGSLIEVMTCYRTTDDGRTEVMVEVACPWENVVKAKLKRSSKETASNKESEGAIESANTL